LRQRGVLGGFAVDQNLRGATRELPSGVGERKPPRSAVDEPRAQSRFDPADGFRDGGFGKFQLRSRPPAKERSSTTLAKIASPSKSGSLVIGSNSETMSFNSFYF
jgi:hypothetical protein